MKPTTTPDAPTPEMATPGTEPGNTNIDGMDALDGTANEGVLLTAQGLARCNSAISGMKALTNILFQLELDKESTGGIQASTRTGTGLIQALAVCTEFLNGHLNGEVAHMYSKTINVESPAYADLERMRRSD